MKPLHPINRRYRQILLASLISSGSVLPLLPALADATPPNGGQNSAAPGEIQNQATAAYEDSADASPQTAVSDIVKVTVAEIAGISAAASDTLPVNNNAGGAPTRYPTSTVYFDFIVKNEGNDPTKLFIPAAPSIATVGGAAVTAGQLTIVSYSTAVPGTGLPANPVTGAAAVPLVVNTAAAVNTPVNQTTGTATDSVPAGGYVTVRVPITVPLGSANGAAINVTLGNTAGQPSNTNTPFVAGGNVSSGNDLLTQDNANNGAPGETDGVPFNGDAAGKRQEASASQTTTVVVPKVTISGKVYDDANNSAVGTFANIQNGTEAGAVATPNPVYAVLVNSSNKVIQSVQVINNGTNGTSGTNGTYSFANVDGYQNGLYVILSSTDLAANTNVTTASETLPTGWTATSPLKYTAFDVTNGDTTTLADSYKNKDFGIELLPTALGATGGSQTNVVGPNFYPVPASAFTGSSDSDPNGAGIVAYRITTFPTNTNSLTIGTNTYTSATFPIAGVDFTAVQLANGDVKVDPIDGATTVNIPFRAIDTAGKLSTNTSNGLVPFSADAVTITGTVINDKDKSAVTNPATGTTPITFTNIKTGSEGGTDTLFGTNGTPIYATLYNTDTNQIIASQLIPNTGIYSFSSVSATTNVKVILSTAVPGANGTATAPVAGLPGGWNGTTAPDSGVFNTGNYGTNVAVGGFAPKDFGVIQKAKLVIIKRITKIGKTAATMSTTNPNDNTTLLNTTSTDSFNFNATKNPTAPAHIGNWPTNYIVGAVDGGPVKPGDFIEYTIYFMNNQGADAKNVKICDSIRGSQAYDPSSVSINLTSDPVIQGNAVSDLASRLNLFSGSTVPANCNTGVTATGSINGGVAIDITSATTAAADQPVGIPGATGVGTANSYGMFRFRTQVKP